MAAWRRRRGSANLVILLFLGLMVAAAAWIIDVYLYEWVVDHMVPTLEAALNVTMWPEFADVKDTIHQLLYMYPYLMLFVMVFSILGLALRYSARPQPYYP